MPTATAAPLMTLAAETLPHNRIQTSTSQTSTQARSADPAPVQPLHPDVGRFHRGRPPALRRCTRRGPRISAAARSL